MKVVKTDKIIREIVIRENISKEDNNSYIVVIPACSNRRFGIVLPDNKKTFMTNYGNNQFYFFDNWSDVDDYLHMNSFMMDEYGVSYAVRYRIDEVKMNRRNMDKIKSALLELADYIAEKDARIEIEDITTYKTRITVRMSDGSCESRDVDFTEEESK